MTNKFEKLIEFIINDEDQKARELFHTIVVEKSRDIYESIMDEEQVSDDQAEGFAHEVRAVDADECAMEGEEDGEEGFEVGDEEGFGSEGEPTELGGEEEFGGEEGGAEEHAEIEDQVMNIDAKLDELLAKFDEIMGDEGSAEEPAGDEFGGEEPAGDEFGGEEGHEEEPAMMEAQSGKSGSGNPFAKKGSAQSGKSGSGSAASGKSGSAKSGTSGKKGSAELMREYVDRIGDIYGGPGDATEGDAVGATGKKVGVNKKAASVGPGADFGGTAANIVNGKGNSEDPDGKAIKKPSNEYSKGEGKLIGKVQNTPGGDKKLASTGEEYSKEHPRDGSGVGAKETGLGKQNQKSVQKQNTGVKR